MEVKKKSREAQQRNQLENKRKNGVLEQGLRGRGKGRREVVKEKGKQKVEKVHHVLRQASLPVDVLCQNTRRRERTRRDDRRRRKW